ncbi:helix-turn-helix domain-containing protein [Actinomadura madurae]|uniref:PucR family transcriptional regulator n=1 Tax=Actinomadura madurae TaxID=1993 RepID=UPI0020D232FB|nr:helix-turn-helix domain-containing protein [Actinomadura madurae]MCP9967161.1 helix-turn-helix domain-containing protein [Actinomadura madurae]
MTGGLEERSPITPWPGVPSELATLFRPHLDTLAEEMIEEILAGISEYARPRDAEYTRLLRLAVEGALRQFADLVMDPDGSWEQVAAVYREIGRAEAREGRDLEVLQTSLRLGARVAWRRSPPSPSGTTSPAAPSPPSPRRSSRSWTRSPAPPPRATPRPASGRRASWSTAAAGLLDLLLAQPPAAPRAVADLARLARWRVPRTVAAVVLHERGRQPFAHPNLPPDVLADVDRREPCLLVPDPEGPGRGRMLESALGAWVAALGPTVRTEDAARSLRWAREALPLARRGILPSDRLIRCADHMPALVVFRDEDLVRVVADLRLAPLRAVRPRHRERLMRTLLSCLQNGFNATEVASRLHVHPQTVRYRLHQLEELFGARLHDPETRLEMEMALTVALTAPPDDQSID